MADVNCMTAAQVKLFELRMKVNAGKKANKKEMVAEHERLSNPKVTKSKAPPTDNPETESTLDKRKRAIEDAHYLNETAKEVTLQLKKKAKKDKRRAAFGWDVFNQDSLYKAYKKRLQHVPTKTFAPEKNVTPSENDELAIIYESQKVSQEGLDRMSKELEKRVQARKQFSRRRQHYDGEDVDYINTQNRLFNKKASKAFDKYTVEIRQNLERGTAL